MTTPSNMTIFPQAQNAIQKAFLTKHIRESIIQNPDLNKVVAAKLAVESVTITWLAGDGSNRSYYRISEPNGQTWVLMQLGEDDQKKVKSGQYEWIELGEILNQQGIRAPNLKSTLADHGALIIEDYGDETLEVAVKHQLSHGHMDQVQHFYNLATNMICRFLEVPAGNNECWTKLAFDEDRYNWELKFFFLHLIEPLAPELFDPSEKRQFFAESQKLARHLGEFSRYFVHRDFHSRNIMVLGQQLAVIDFQDARFGAAAYDLVSLFFDSYVPFDCEQRYQMMEESIRIISQQLGEEVGKEINETWRLMLIQRQLKALGSFGYLTLDQKRGDYLKYVPEGLRCLHIEKLQHSDYPFLSGIFLEKLKSYEFSNGNL